MCVLNYLNISLVGRGGKCPDSPPKKFSLSGHFPKLRWRITASIPLLCAALLPKTERPKVATFLECCKIIEKQKPFFLFYARVCTRIISGFFPSPVFFSSGHFHHVSTLHLLLPRALLDVERDKG